MTSGSCRLAFQSLDRNAGQLVPLVVAKTAFSVVDVPEIEVLINSLGPSNLLTVYV